MHDDRKNIVNKVLTVDDAVVDAMRKARVDEDVIAAARESGTISRAESIGWTVSGYRGSVMNWRQEKSFEKALNI